MEKTKITVRQLSQCAICTAIIAVCSWIQIPMTVPFTLQTMGIFIALGLLGGKLGTMSILAYVLLGAVGVPVFAGFSGGFGIILGTTGGYIIGFIASGLIVWLFEKLMGDSLPVKVASMSLGMILCYVVGTVWFIAVYSKNTGSVGIMQALSWCVFPFIIPDAVKIAVALLLSGRVKKYVAA